MTHIDLPDQRTADSAPNHRSRLASDVRRASRAAEKNYKDQHPEARGLSVGTQIWTYQKPPAALAQAPARMVENFLINRGSLAETNKAIIARLHAVHAPYAVSVNFMAKKLTPSQLEAIARVLASAGKEIDLGVANTLSRIKAKLRALAHPESTSRKYTPSIIFEGNSVVVGKVRYAVSRHRSGYDRIRVGRTWLRCDALEAMLASAR